MSNHNIERLLERLAGDDPAVSKVAQDAFWIEADDDDCDRVSAFLANTRDLRMCKVAIQALYNMGNARAQDALFTALEDADTEIRVAAAEALWLCGDVRALEPLRRAQTDPDEEVRRAATWTLTALGAIPRKKSKFDRLLEEKDLEALRGMLKDPDPDVRATAIDALVVKKDSGLLDVMVPMLRDPVAKVVNTVCLALATLENPAAVPPLLDLLAAVPPSESRAMAAYALGQLKDPGAFVPLAEAAGGDPDLNTRLHAIMALAKVGGAEAAKPLIVILCLGPEAPEGHIA